MNVGPLPFRCRIEYPVVTSQDSDTGSDVIEWRLLAVRWCGLQDVMPSRAESVKEGVEIATKQTRIRLNYCRDVDATMRIVVMRPTREVYRLISEGAILGDKQAVEFMAERVSTDG